MDVLRGVEGIAFTYFDERDVVRHSLVQRIVKAYDRYGEMTGASRQLSLRLGNEPAPEPLAEPVESMDMTPVEIAEFPPVA
jgi:phosphate starvation-inducible PhoH-like protein